ncbi:MAG TPA: amino acid racemase, partial [Bacteroidia bacterium]
MKKLGLIGGISWISTADYYSYINKIVSTKLGGLNNAPCIIHSFNMSDIEKLMKAGEYNKVLEGFSDAAIKMKQAGAEGLVICANTMHMFADELEKRSGLPVIHLVTATARAIRKQNLDTIGLLGTLPTMNLDFYRDKLSQLGIKTLVPGEEDKQFVHDSIFSELSRGIFTDEMRARYFSIMEKLKTRGAQGIVLGCTD